MYSDNKGAEAATRKGAAKSWDHCQMIHEILTQVCKLLSPVVPPAISPVTGLADPCTCLDRTSGVRR